MPEFAETGWPAEHGEGGEAVRGDENNVGKPPAPNLLIYRRTTDRLYSVEVRHADRKLQRLEENTAYTAGFGRDVVRAYRKVMQIIRHAADERDFYELKSLRYEKLKGDRAEQRSMQLNRQFRLVLTIEVTESRRTAVIIELVDYH
ncbi:MAG TPA: type II toxin-antitoxin system RelE/ParE family toxin [Tepidisphaeraceae bacterium]|jgi:proteic killer suppression protein